MLHRHWVSLSNAICLPGMPCSLPRWTEPVLLSVTSRLVLPSPFPRRVGVHDFAFEACSSFTRVTTCRVARPPYSGLCHEASTRPVTRAGPLVSYHVYRQLHGWVLPPLANCAGKAHSEMPAESEDHSDDHRDATQAHQPKLPVERLELTGHVCFSLGKPGVLLPRNSAISTFTSPKALCKSSLALLVQSLSHNSCDPFRRRRGAKRPTRP